MVRPYRPSRTSRVPSAAEGSRPPSRDRHGEVPLQVGASHLDVQPVELRQDVWVRVPVLVVGADPDHADLGADRFQEHRFGGGRSVVGDREQLGLELGPVRLEQVELCRRFHIAGGQHPLVGEVDAQDVGAVVELAALVPVRASRGRMQHLDPQVADHDLVTGQRRPDRDGAVGGDLVHLGGLR